MCVVHSSKICSRVIALSSELKRLSDEEDRLLRELGTFTEQQMQVCYLMRIGLSKPQIQNMTNLSRTTVWRWVNRYDWADKAEDK